MKAPFKHQFNDYPFLLLFASEFTYYLLILQTGIVEYHNSIMGEVWMLPVGGVSGIIASIFLHKEQYRLMPALLALQLLLSMGYPDVGSVGIFVLGLISGLTAPMLIARIESLWLVVVALALSYSYGTYCFDIIASQRDTIAIFLTLVALGASLLHSETPRVKSPQYFSLLSGGAIFLWLLLDAALFETLSRDAVMSLWGEGKYEMNIILFHLLGLIVAFLARDFKYNTLIILALFFVTYTLYALKMQWELSVVYPLVISYYNVAILNAFMKLTYPLLAIMALSLWAASGAGLMIALSSSFEIAWVALALLAFVEILRVSIGHGDENSKIGRFGITKQSILDFKESFGSAKPTTK